MDDIHIIELYYLRNEDAIKETALKYGRLCYKIAYNVLGSREDAEECVNDTYAGIWSAIPPARPENLTAFISKIARNLSLKRLEHRSRDKRSGVSVSLSELENVVAVTDAFTVITDEELGRLISSFLRGETREVRGVFIRKYFFFDSVKDISKRYSFTESKVKSMLFHTRKKLAEYLRENGVFAR